MINTFANQYALKYYFPVEKQAGLFDLPFARDIFNKSVRENGIIGDSVRNITKGVIGNFSDAMTHMSVNLKLENGHQSLDEHMAKINKWKDSYQTKHNDFYNKVKETFFDKNTNGRNLLSKDQSIQLTRPNDHPDVFDHRNFFKENRGQLHIPLGNLRDLDSMRNELIEIKKTKPVFDNRKIQELNDNHFQRVDESYRDKYNDYLSRVEQVKKANIKSYADLYALGFYL